MTLQGAVKKYLESKVNAQELDNIVKFVMMTPQEKVGELKLFLQNLQVNYSARVIQHTTIQSQLNNEVTDIQSF